MQKNTRISRSLKERVGYTPSQAIRKLRDNAARNAHNPHAAQSLFDTEDEAGKPEAEEERAGTGDCTQGGGANIVAYPYEQYGIKPSN